MELPDYNFEFSDSSAIREIHSEANEEWRECKIPNSPNTNGALTSQQT